MRPQKCTSILLPKNRRCFYIFSSFLGLYFIYLFVFKIRDFKSKSINGVSWLHPVGLTSNASSHGDLHNWILEIIKPPRSSSIQGVLNVHTWAFACELSLEKFVDSPLFPIYPNSQTFLDILEMKWKGQHSKDVKSFGTRIFGFILAPYTGNYVFSVSTTNNVELWLSRDKKWNNIELLCKSGNYNASLSSFCVKDLDSNIRNSSQSHTSEIHLKKNHFYFIEILQTQIPGSSFHLMWKMPHSQNFIEMSMKYFYSFMGKSLEFKEFIKVVPLTSATQSYITSYPRHSVLPNTGNFLSGIKYVKWSDVKLVLPLCPYRPGYVGKRVLYQYHAVEHFVNPSYVYPEVKHVKVKDGKWIPWFPLSEKEATHIVTEYLKHLEDAYPGKYKLKQILNVEKKPDWHKDNQEFYKGTSKHGDRFFLELFLQDNTSNQDVILSEYIYQHSNGSKKLCYPEDMQWNKSAPLYLLISARKQAAWLWHFINNVKQLYESTADQNLHVIVYDYNSTDIDIEAHFMQSSFKNYKILKNPDSKYSRTYSLNRAAKAVTDPNAIVFTLDLHLEIPASFPNNVRKHCIKGKMVFTPIIARLSCGASPKSPSGGWDPWGYGMFGAYKTDWDKLEGFDEVHFKTKWGGEDWDLVDRAYRVGLEFERIKQADFYHYHHARVGMWT